jgi:hypothetical protein
MPADTLTIPLTGQLADDVRTAAEARGLTPEEYVRQELAESVALDAIPEDDLSWEEDIRRLEEPGENIDLETAFAEFRQKIAEARRAKP